ncbi:hypothetical protein KAI87_04485, partial [Myxococcota bacterium]|nr:hypothetical protein [Myxococcota bacterium]
YDRKIGPLAQIARTLRYEDAKLENGGEGQGGSTMVKPTEKSDSSSDEAKSTEPEVSQPEAGSEL